MCVKMCSFAFLTNYCMLPVHLSSIFEPISSPDDAIVFVAVTCDCAAAIEKAKRRKL